MIRTVAPEASAGGRRLPSAAVPIALSVAGSDSGGGAGIQADLKTFEAFGCHGTCAITAVTAQNSLGVASVFEMPVEMLRDQIDRVVEDLRPAGAKTGMLSSASMVEAVARAFADHRIERLVVDPVMVAKGGRRLLEEPAVDVLRTRLIPLAAVITPNLPEAEVLLGRPIAGLEERRRAARDLVRLGCRAAVITGGHAAGDPDDVLCEGSEVTVLSGPRIATTDTHGGGCTFSAAVAAGLARGKTVAESVAAAKEHATGAIEHARRLGSGHGPVDPLWRWRDTPGVG